MELERVGRVTVCRNMEPRGSAPPLPAPNHAALPSPSSDLDNSAFVFLPHRVLDVLSTA